MCEKNDFKKDSRAKTPRRKVKYFIFFFSELGVLCVFARVISLPIP
jgi:hypothetical protein